MVNKRGARVTLARIAEKVGLSRMAVSLALRGHASIPEKTRARVRAAARKLGYRPDANLGTMMARVRGGVPAGETAMLMILNLSRWSGLLEEVATFSRFVQGARRRAEELGFALDTLWAGDPELSSRRLRSILAARGVQGVLLGWVEGELKAPNPREFFAGPMVGLGRRLDGVECDHVSNDQFATAWLAGERLYRAGARRIGLIIGDADRAVDYRYSGGFFALRGALPDGELAPVFNSDPATGKDFAAWWRRERPDGLLLHDERAATWLREIGPEAVRHTRLAMLNWRADRAELAGTDQRSDVIGAIAVDRLVARIRVPGAETAAAQGIFVQSVWREAERVRS